MFTKKHYEKIADTLIKANASLELVIDFMKMLTDDNEKFNREKFLERIVEGWNKK